MKLSRDAFNLSDEKQSIDYYVWKLYDQQPEWVIETLHPLFLSLEFQSSDITQALVTQIENSQQECTEQGEFKKADRRLIKSGKLLYLPKEDDVNPH